MTRIALSFAVALALSACNSSPTPAAADTATPSPAAAETTPSPPPAADVAKRCDAANAQWAVGKPADQTLIDKAVSDSGSQTVRVIKPGEAVTMDFREDRLNIEVDAENNVATVRCG
ncbi:I78 family peptidase inhibitor [Luteimonas sp. SX5]|uniref:I78 family peptidase inhibitor n=1 Tax=Luteimonas galliterrae TaxID=2940486 RepID=A0ABT0MME8_9GAMM|nr:I78 family peptidase inhibitor [Luteimonas galliterrae]MCL1636051.1 I78 family peptidase inhibitor [Luteimonas galliterrae]